MIRFCSVLQGLYQYRFWFGKPEKDLQELWFGVMFFFIYLWHEFDTLVAIFIQQILHTVFCKKKELQHDVFFSVFYGWTFLTPGIVDFGYCQVCCVTQLKGFLIYLNGVKMHVQHSWRWNLYPERFECNLIEWGSQCLFYYVNWTVKSFMRLQRSVYLHLLLSLRSEWSQGFHTSVS